MQLLTPTWSGDLPHFRLQRALIARSPLASLPHQVVVQNEDLGLFEAKAAELCSSARATAGRRGRSPAGAPPTAAPGDDTARGWPVASARAGAGRHGCAIRAGVHSRSASSPLPPIARPIRWWWIPTSWCCRTLRHRISSTVKAASSASSAGPRRARWAAKWPSGTGRRTPSSGARRARLHRAMSASTHPSCCTRRRCAPCWRSWNAATKRRYETPLRQAVVAAAAGAATAALVGVRELPALSLRLPAPERGGLARRQPAGLYLRSAGSAGRTRGGRRDDGGRACITSRSTRRVPVAGLWGGGGRLFERLLPLLDAA